MFRKIILKIVLMLLALIGIHLPAQAYVCTPGHGIPGPPSDCEVVQL